VGVADFGKEGFGLAGRDAANRTRGDFGVGIGDFWIGVLSAEFGDF